MGGLANQRRFSNGSIESSYPLRSCAYALSVRFLQRRALQKLASRAAIFRRTHG
jgi:hypothetical protein